MTKKPTINRRGWLACWLQKRRRKRQHKLLPAPVLVAQYPSLAVWEWNYANPARWNAYNSLDGGVTYHFDDWVTGSARQYAPDGGDHLMFIVGVDANGNEITERSNAVLPEDGEDPGVLNAPLLVSLGTVAGSTTWRGVAPVAVDDWQFCINDEVFDPEVKSFDQWVADADFPDTDFDTINATTASVTADHAYCAARYRVGTTWSSWTGVVDATVIAPPAPVVVSFQVTDNGGLIDLSVVWTWDGKGWPDDGYFQVYAEFDDPDQGGGEGRRGTAAGMVPGPGRNLSVQGIFQAADIGYYCKVQYHRGTAASAYSVEAEANPY